MKTLLILCLTITASCGRRNQDKCRSREYMRVQCQVQTIPSYGRPYAVELCDRNYEVERCY